MKIISQTSKEILISSPKTTFLEKFTWFILTFVFGSVFAFMPMSIVLISLSEIGVLKIHCDRVEPKQVDCQLSKSKFLDLVQQKPLDYKFINLVKHNVITSKDSDGGNVYRYNFSLITTSGEKVPFTRTSSSTAGSVTLALNSFLQSKQESFRYTLDERSESSTFGSYLILFFILPFVLAGLCFIWIAFSLLVDYEEILLDKPEYQLKHTQRTILGTKVNRFLFTEIAKVDLLYATDSYQNISFIPRIIIHSNLQFKLDNITDRQAAIKIANDLNQFMGLPEEEDPVVKK